MVQNLTTQNLCLRLNKEWRDTLQVTSQPGYAQPQARPLFPPVAESSALSGIHANPSPRSLNIPGPALRPIPHGWHASLYNEQQISQPASLSPFMQTASSSPSFASYGAAEKFGSQNAHFISPASGQQAYTLHNSLAPAGSTAAALAMQRPADFVEVVQPEDLTPRAGPIVRTFQDVNLTSEVVAFEEQAEEEGEDLEGEIQPRRWPIPARPREGVIY
jgi:hypothetical protein